MKSTRILRLSVAGILLFSLLVILAPRMSNYVSTSAVINAPLVVIRSPIKGRVLHALSGIAVAVAPGTPILKVEGSALIELEAAQSAQASRIIALEDQLRGLTADETRSRDHTLRWLDEQERALDFAVKAAAARLHEVSARSNRVLRLAENGNVSTATAEALESELAVSRLEFETFTSELASLEVQREALVDGVTLNPTQTLDALTIKKSEITVDIARARAEVAVLTVRLGTQEFEPSMPNYGVIRSTTSAGTLVLPGDELASIVDCDRRFLEVAVPETYFESIVPGALARVLLKGSAQSFEGRVIAVRGAGAKPEQAELYAEPPQVPAGQLRVFVNLDPMIVNSTVSAEVASTFCDVGRTAEVRFERSIAHDLALFGFSLPWDGDLPWGRPEDRVAEAH